MRTETHRHVDDDDDDDDGKGDQSPLLRLKNTNGSKHPPALDCGSFLG